MSGDLPVWLIRRLKNTMHCHQQAGDGRDYRDGYYAALKWVLSLREKEDDDSR